MVEYTNCPYCGSKELEYVFSAEDYTVSHKKFKIDKCNNCEGRITNPVPPLEEIGEYYKSEDYISHSNTSKGFINFIYQKVRNYTLGSKQRLINKVTGLNKGSILDIGSGTGGFLNRMNLKGWQTLGIEPDEDAKKMSISNHKLTVLPIDQFYGLEEGKHDVITMWHVLEHVHELKQYMEKISKLLVDKGYLLIAVPNYQSFDGSFYKEKWAAYDVPRHLYHFSPKSMKVLLNNNGFDIIEKKGMPFDPFYVSMLSERNTKGNLIKGITIGKMSWFRSLFNTDKASSIIYIAKKR